MKHERPRPEAGGAVDEPRQSHPTVPLPAYQETEPAGPVPMHHRLPWDRDVLDTLRRLADALDRQAAPPRLAYRLSEIAAALGVSRRLLEQARAAGRLPKPDLRIGRVSLWTVETVRDWMAQQAPRRGGRAS